jgi:tetratricopeptide (TPR) repeat protein
MTPKQAIDELEKLRYAWRGDDTELKVLTRLGKLYLDVGDYRNGFTTLREAVTYFPQSPQLPAIKDTMRLAFASLYLNGGADKMPTLAALSLYDDFRDLAPTGEAGDVVTSKLVNRLVQVELLDRAADLLKQQIDKRLKGAPLADAVNQLAVIHLLARQPEQALAVLSRPITPDATPTAASQRRLITARTLGELARYREALNLLENDTSVDADRLRAEIGWRTQNWPLAAAAFEKLVPAAGQAMTDADRQTVLRLAIAQSLNDNAAGLKELRKTYGKTMAESAYKESFNLVTAPPGDGPAVDLRAITRQVAEVDQFRAFITSYRDKLLTRKDAPVKPASALPAKADQQTAAAAN